MNIFILDKDPIKCAEMHCDKHVVKMIVESCQMLANAFTLDQLKSAPKTIKGNYRKHSYVNHPCSKWVLESRGNFVWLWDLTQWLIQEYRDRYKKSHSLEKFVIWVLENNGNINFPKTHRTPFVQAMPDEYKDKDVVKAYRNYYLKEKLIFAQWKNGNVPSWVRENNK